MFPFNTRINNIFPTGDPSQTPNMGAGMVDPNFLNHMIGLIHNERTQAKNEAQTQMAMERQRMDRDRNFAEGMKYAGPTEYKTEYAPPPTFQGMTPEKEEELGLKGKAIAAQYGFKGAQLAQGQEKIDLNRQIGMGKLQEGQQKIGISKERADAYSNLQNVKAKYQGSAIKAQRGGNFVVIHPDGTTMDTGIDTGTMTEEDLQQMKNDGVIDAIDERGNQQRQTDAAKPQKVTPTSGYSTQKLNMARAQEFTNANPDMAHVVKFDPTNNTIVINPEGDGGMFGKAVTKEMRQKAYNWIYKGDGSAISSTTGGAVKSADTSGVKFADTNETVKVKDKDGKTGTIPKSQLEDAKKQGYTEIKGGDDE